MATDTTMRQQLAEVFKDAVASHEEVMIECLSMCKVYGLSPQDLFFKYEAFLLSRPSGLRAKLSTFTLEVARELRKEVQRESQAKGLAASISTPNEKAAATIRRKPGTNGGDLGFLDGLSTPVRKPKTQPTRLSNAGNNANLPSPSGFTTPARPTAMAGVTPTGPTASSYRPTTAGVAGTPLGKSADSPAPLGARSPQPFHLRADPHTLLETFNAHLEAGPGAPGVKSRVALATTVETSEREYRYMFEKMSARSEALDEQIDDYGDVIREAYQLAELGDPAVTSEEEIYCVGRILAPPTDGAKANTANLFLQSSRMLSGGRVVALRFAPPGTLKVRGGASGVRGFGLFPGCIACLKGRNGGGGVFVVNEVLMPPPSEMPASTVPELVDYQQGPKLAGAPMSVHIAAGPYTLDHNLGYEPLDALMDVACDERPDVLILLGPFVDSAHPHIQSGKISVSPIELFREQVAARIARINEVSPATTVILIPSVRDLISQHAAFPQPAFEREGLGLSKKVRILPNPCSFSINEVLVSLASPDVLFHLRREEVFQVADEAVPDPSVPVSKNPQGDGMANLVRHVLGQRTFYPLFPAPEDLAHDVNLDVTHWHNLRLEDTAPDILILPSRLKHFSKVVDSTLALNPGHLSRANTAGTFTKLMIHPSKSLVDDGEYQEHRVDERTRSEVWRI